MSLSDTCFPFKKHANNHSHLKRTDFNRCARLISGVQGKHARHQFGFTQIRRKQSRKFENILLPLIMVQGKNPEYRSARTSRQLFGQLVKHVEIQWIAGRENKIHSGNSTIGVFVLLEAFFLNVERFSCNQFSTENVNLKTHKDFSVPLHHISATELLYLDAAQMFLQHNL